MKNIPILILHRNEFENLFLMLESIKKNTNYPHRIFVIDNNSNDELKEIYLNDLEKDKNVNLIRSSKNNWILGFNAGFKDKRFDEDSDFFVLSDADIVLPPVDANGKCWLEKMVEQMNLHACIGKLGISLKTDDIDNVMLKKSVVEQKEKFLKNPKIGANYIAPVDTTLAIYRKNFFISKKFKISVGHASLARPYFYTCRTSNDIQARHLGWYERHRLQLNSKQLSEKIRCFAIYGAHIDPEILDNVNIFDRIFYNFVHPIFYIFWGVNVFFKNLSYTFKRFPRNINELQNECRK